LWLYGGAALKVKYLNLFIFLRVRQLLSVHLAQLAHWTFLTCIDYTQCLEENFMSSEKIESGENKPYKKRQRSKPFKLTDEVLKEIEILGGHGATLDNLRIYYGVRESKFYKICEENPAIVDAIFRGRTKTTFSVAGLLLEKAKGGNVAAMIFYLKTQGRWVEHHIPGLTDTPRDKVIPKSLGTDPVEASRIYQEIMK